MTEADWLRPGDLQPHVEHLLLTNGAEVLRKLRLFSIACCRQLLPWLAEPRVQEALNRSEEYADGRLTSPALAKWRREVEQLHAMAWRRRTVRITPAADAAYSCAVVACQPNAYGYDRCWEWLVSRAEAFGPEFQAAGPAVAHRLLLEVCGNPFRRVRFIRKWRTATVAAVAEGAYAARDFARLPVLADALEDAGCDAADLLAHLRGPGPHVRGCWALDLVLGKG